jgi:biotin/methionine sulfoxide reductase
MEKYRETVVCTHWGNYRVSATAGKVNTVTPVSTDSNPSPIGESLLDVHDPNCRIAGPLVRESYLRGDADHRERRGREGFVEISWDSALDLAANAIDTVIADHGNQAIFGGSYGWSSAGRFHHAQSQLHRFLNCLGGYTASVDTYSAAAAEVILPYILGGDSYTMVNNLIAYQDIVDNTDLLLAFGGLCLHNNQVVPGGVADHKDKQMLQQLADAGIDVVNISPLKDDIPAFMTAEWLQARPNTDTAIMLALAYMLETRGHVDRDFLERYTVGYDVFKSYLLGECDGIPKDIPWAASICGLSEIQLQHLAEKLVDSRRPLITVALSLQRTEHGEQPYWMATVLAAMLGQMGLKGGGLGLGWGSNGRGFYNRCQVPFAWGRFEQGRNPVDTWIPVA